MKGVFVSSFIKSLYATSICSIVLVDIVVPIGSKVQFDSLVDKKRIIPSHIKLAALPLSWRILAGDSTPEPQF